MMACIGLLVASTFACGSATSFNMFLCARVMQGVGEAVDTVAFATFLDHYPDMYDRTRIGAQLGSIQALVPVIAPPVGGLLASYFGWRFAFFLLASACAFFGVLCYTTLNESVNCTDEATRDTTWLQDFWFVIYHRHRLVLLVVSALMVGVPLTMESNSSFILEVDFHLSLERTAVLFGSQATAALAGGMISSILMGVLQLRPLKVLQVAMASLLVSPVLMMVSTHYVEDLQLGPALYMASIYSFMLISPSSQAMGIFFEQQLQHIAGTARGICMFLINVIGAVVSIFGSKAATHGASYVLFFMAQLLLGACILYWVGFGANPPEWAVDTNNAAAANAEQSEEANLKDIAAQKMRFRSPVFSPLIRSPLCTPMLSPMRDPRTMLREPYPNTPRQAPSSPRFGDGSD